MSKQIYFYTDEHVSKSVIKGLRRRGVDVLTTPEASSMGASDAEHLKLAKKEGRVIFTQDADFLRLHAKTVEHSGIVYASVTTPVGEIIKGLMLIHDILSSEDMIDHVEFI